MTGPKKFFAFSALLLAGCGMESGDQSMVADSAGVLIVSNHATEASALPEWTLQDEPVFSVGELAPTPNHELYRVYYARAFDDGRVAISLGLSEIRVFAGDGSHIITIGREGDGPGEFSFLWDAHPVGDTIIRAIDIQQRRVSLFDAHSGELLSENPIGVGFSNPNGVALFGDGTFAGLASPPRADPLQPYGRLVVHYGLTGEWVDTLSELPAEAPPGPIRPDLYYKFTPSFSSAAGGESVWVGWEGRYEFLQYDLLGNLIRIIRSPILGDPVTEQIQEAEMSGASGGPGARQMVFPERLPPWDKILATPSGWLWVRRYPSPLEEGQNTWDIFDPEGRQAAVFRIDSGVRICEVGDDFLLGIFRTELDVQVVKKYKLDKATES
jgi:hypothetical protein